MTFSARAIPQILLCRLASCLRYWGFKLFYYKSNWTKSNWTKADLTKSDLTNRKVNRPVISSLLVLAATLLFVDTIWCCCCCCCCCESGEKTTTRSPDLASRRTRNVVWFPPNTGAETKSEFPNSELVSAKLNQFKIRLLSRELRNCEKNSLSRVATCGFNICLLHFQNIHVGWLKSTWNCVYTHSLRMRFLNCGAFLRAYLSRL